MKNIELSFEEEQSLIFEIADPAKPIRMQKHLWQMLYHTAKSDINDCPVEVFETVQEMENTVILLCGYLENIYEKHGKNREVNVKKLGELDEKMSESLQNLSSEVY